MEVKIEPSWKKILEKEFDEDYFAKLTEFVKEEYKTSTVYPPAKFIFRAFWETPFDKVKVVILGQDPYHGKGEANGLCFDVDDGVRLPPSLQNIYKELKIDLGTDGNIKKCTYMLKHVNNWKIWLDLTKEYKEVDYTQFLEDKDYTKPMDTIACAGGKCELN